MKITMPLQWAEAWLDVEAELVDVAPHLASELTFAIHRNPEGSMRWGRWSISNVETGLHLYTGWSRAKTIEGATAKTAPKGIRHARRGLRKAAEKYPQIAVLHDQDY